MKKAAGLVFFVVLLSAAVSPPNQAQVVSVGILPFQDESGSGVPPELLLKLAQDLRRKLVLSYPDVLARIISGVSETSGMGVDELAAIGKKQGVRYVLRGGILALASEKAGQELRCSVGLYAELVASESSAVASLRANGAGAEENPSLDDVRRWETYDFGSEVFAQTALGRALNEAGDQLTQQVYQATQPPSQPQQPAVPAEIPPQPPAADQAASSYEADQELQQLIAQAEALVASGAASGLDVGSLQQALEELRAALNNKMTMMEQGQDTSAVDQEIARAKTNLQDIITAHTQAAAAQPPPSEPQPMSSERKSVIAKIGDLLGDALTTIQKIQEIRAALQGAQEGQAAAEPAITEEPAPPVEEPATDVSGVVVDAEGDPVEGATVTDPESGASGTTDSSGSYTIPGIPGGRFTEILVIKNGRQLSSGKILLPIGRPALADWKIGPGSGGPGLSGMKIFPANVVLSPRIGAKPADLGAIKGVVRDELGRPVARALVMISGLGLVRTDSSGQYAFLNVPQGTYQVVIKKGGATVQTLQVSVFGRKAAENRILVPSKAGAPPPVLKGIALAKGAGTLLRGTVISEERRPLGGTKVTAVHGGGGGVLSVFAAGNGIYEFKDLRAVSYRLLANKGGFQEASQSVVLQAGRSEIRNFTLKRSSALIQKALTTVRPSPAGKATTPRLTVQPPREAAKGHLYGQVLAAGTRKPVSQATVQVSGQQAGRTDSQGRYRINSLPAGSHRVVASHPDFQEEARTVTIRPNGTTEEDFSLRGKEKPRLELSPGPVRLKPRVKPGQVSGRVTDSKTGKPVAQASIALANRTTESNASGRYSFTDVPAGRYTINFRKTGYQDGSRRINVVAGKTATANMRLVPKALLQVIRK
jgi:protocatechuate 3,4-dioxygenase beta subunit